MMYKGWKIYENPWGPVTGRWRAVRFGVGLGGNTLDLVKRMIDAKIYDQKEQSKM